MIVLQLETAQRSSYISGLTNLPNLQNTFDISLFRSTDTVVLIILDIGNIFALATTFIIGLFEDLLEHSSTIVSSEIFSESRQQIKMKHYFLSFCFDFVNSLLQCPLFDFVLTVMFLDC